MCSAAMIKKKTCWTTNLKSQDRASEMQGKKVGDIRVRKGSSTNGENSNYVHLVALIDRKYTSMMLTRWSTTIINGETKKRRVGSELVQFKNVEVQKNCYYGRHAVYDNANNRQGYLSLEEEFYIMIGIQGNYDVLCQIFKPILIWEITAFHRHKRKKPSVKLNLAEGWSSN